MRFLPISLTVLLVELANLDETLALFASLEARPVAGIVEVIPAARTLMIRFQPDLVTPEALAAELRGRDRRGRPTPSDRLVEVPVHYTGEDLDEVGRLLGIEPAEVIRRHTASEFVVAFTGFAPGFGYLVGGDPSLYVPRRQSPRARIPAGAVALAGQFSGVYPKGSPGGWQIIGVTPLAMWDMSRQPPALMQPGTRVRFVDLGGTGATMSRMGAPDLPAAPDADVPPLGLRILASQMPALFQDLGRPGLTSQGVSLSGALDRGALRAANRAVGNPPGTPCLEVTQGSLRFEVIGRAVVAVTGAPCPIRISSLNGVGFGARTYRAIALEAGDVVELSPPGTGMRSYLAVRGGFAVERVLDSAATDTLAQIGPKPVEAGATLPILSAAGLTSVSMAEEPPWAFPASGETVTLDVVMGPRTDWFTPAGVARLTGQPWTVTPQSSRVGIRLAGNVALERRDATELPSEGTTTGAIQVPHSGQPVLFLADHPLTGGYPVIATVAEYHLDLAAQIPIGAQIRFHPIRPFSEIPPSPAV